VPFGDAHVPPASVVSVLRRNAPGDDLVGYAPTDLDGTLHYRAGHLVITEKRALMIVGEQIVDSHSRSSGEHFASHIMTGSGVFLVIGPGGTKALAYFSRRYADTYLRLADRLGAIARMQQENTGADAETGWRGNYARDWVAEPLRGRPRSIMRRLLTYLWPHRKTLAFTIGLFAAANLLLLLIPQLTRILLDDWLIPDRFVARPIALLIGAMAVANVVRAGVVILRNRGIARLSAGLVYDLRASVYDSVQRMSLRYITGKPPGDVLNRITDDTTNLREFLQEWGTDGISQVLLFLVMGAITFAQNWRLALLTVATLPLASLVALLMWRLVRWMERTHHRLHDRIGSFVHDVLAGIRVVKAFRNESSEIERYKELTARKYVIDVRNQKVWRTMGPTVEFSLRIGELLMFLAGGALVLRGELRVGELVQFAAYVVLLVEPMMWMGELPQRFIEALTSAERIFEAMDQEPEITSVPEPVAKTLHGDVVFRDVHFAYRPGEPVISDFSLEVAAGEMIGIVGASGAGKSTVINLLLRLYDVDQGTIEIDGVDLRSLDRLSSRSQIGVVLQDPFLFSGTIAENIRYAKPNARDAEVMDAACIAQAHEFIMDFPDGYDTSVGERGQRLSGGERQRISIARAVLHNPRILILDEATSALDLETEERIHTALTSLRTDRTVLAIAHRLATLRGADRLVVMDNGGIAEMGTHAELMAARGRYYAMVEAQRALSDARTLSQA
jgi:ATP-binding cassette, subfamily B, bacterial